MYRLPRTIFLFLLVALAALSACNLQISPQSTAPETLPTSLSLVEVAPAQSEWDACSTDSLVIRARVRLSGADLESARLEYRLVGEGEGPWQMQPMVQVSRDEDTVLVETVVARSWAEEDPPTQLQYAVVAGDTAGAETRWPAAAGEYSAVRVLACPEQAQAPPATEVAAGEPEPSATPLPAPEATPTFAPIPATLVPSPTPTQLVLVLPTATPTPMTFGLPPSVYYSQGQEEDMRELNFFDLDEGKRYTSFNLNADFQLHPGDDPYQDDIRPFNGALFQWFGPKPIKEECAAISGSQFTESITILWPEMKDSYFCYVTSDGRVGWLRVDVWVSLPINERRLIFTWGTFK